MSSSAVACLTTLTSMQSNDRCMEMTLMTIFNDDIKYLLNQNRHSKTLKCRVIQVGYIEIPPPRNESFPNKLNAAFNIENQVYKVSSIYIYKK